jgi:hypothetical protein
MRVLGVDPGGQSVGIVVREGHDLLHHRTVTRGDQTIDVWTRTVLDDLDRAAGVGFLDLCAVEGLNHPTPQMGLANVRGLLDTATVLGAVIGWCDQLDVVVVPPGRHGRAADGLGRAGLSAAYPAELVGPRETSGTGALRHCRAAWDCAGVAAKRSRLAREVDA